MPTLPPGWTIKASRSQFNLVTPEGDTIVSADTEAPCVRAAWCATPDPVPVDWLRSLLAHGVELQGKKFTQGEAARLLHVTREAFNRWAGGKREPPWAAADWLRCYIRGESPRGD